MFKDDYKSQMDKITPDAQTKEMILEKLNKATQPPKKRNPAFVWRVATASVLCAVITLSVIFMPKLRQNGINSVPSEDGFTATAESYEAIYNKIAELNSYKFYNYNGMTYSDQLLGSDVEDFAPEISIDSNGDDVSTNTNTNKQEGDYSTTNRQVEDVDEGDIVKTDGKYIYHLSAEDKTPEIKIYKADGKKTHLAGSYMLDDKEGGKYLSYKEIYLFEDKLAVIRNCYKSNTFYTEISVLDVSNPSEVKLLKDFSQSGEYSSSRLVNSHIYLLTNYSVNSQTAKKDDPETYIPMVFEDQDLKLFALEDIVFYNEQIKSANFQNIVSYDIKELEVTDQKSVLDPSQNIYCNSKNLILTRSSYKSSDWLSASYTIVTRFALEKGKISYVTSGEISGFINNQFSIDEYNDTFRFVTTVDIQEFKTGISGDAAYKTVTKSERYNYLCVLDENLKLLGEISDIAPDERIYSARFMGDTAYFVTFRQVDPLFCVDLSNPKEPKILSALKIPGFSNFLYPFTENTLLGIGQEESRVKLSMFDISNKEDVTENDKFIIENSFYSSANNNHKATLISKEKNLIGFANVCIEERNYYSMARLSYKIFGYENGAFVEKADISLPFSESERDLYQMCNLTRGLYIGDYLYIISPNNCAVYSLTDFESVVAISEPLS